MEQPNFFAIIPANVRYDEKLKPNAKLLYGEITALCNRDGFCWARNDYFAGLYKVNHKTISRWISQLVSGGYISLKVFKNDGNKRKIFISNSRNNLVPKRSRPSDKKSTTLVIKKSLPSDKKVTSNIRMNNTINNTVNREETALAFLEENHPSQFEVLMQCKNQINDFVKFTEMFEATVEQEKLKLDLSVISGRFKKYARNWIDNQSKYDTQVISLNPNQTNDKIGGF